MENTFGAIFFRHTTPEMMMVWAFFSSVFGMIIHWCKVTYKDKMDVGTSFEYFFVKDLRSTILALLSMAGALFATFAPIDYTTVTTYQVILQAFSIGYLADSTFTRNIEDGGKAEDDPMINSPK